MALLDVKFNERGIEALSDLIVSGRRNSSCSSYEEMDLTS